MDEMHKNWPGFVAAVKVADAGSFSAAGRLLDLTPAAVGKSIGQLERRLGVRVFNRTTRQLSLTPEGEQVVASARAAMRALEDAAAVARPQAELSGLVRISCGLGYGRQFVLPVIAQILERHPQLRIDLSLSDQMVDLVKEGFDIGIRGGREPPQGMVARRLLKTATLLVASPAYLAVHGTPQDWTELSQHRRIGLRFAAGHIAAWHFKQGGRVHTLEDKPTLLLSGPELLVDAALLHQGIAQIAEHHAGAALRSGALIPVLRAQYLATPVDISIFYPHRVGLAARVRQVVELLLAGLHAKGPAG